MPDLPSRDRPPSDMPHAIREWIVESQALDDAAVRYPVPPQPLELDDPAERPGASVAPPSRVWHEARCVVRAAGRFVPGVFGYFSGRVRLGRERRRVEADRLDLGEAVAVAGLGDPTTIRRLVALDESSDPDEAERDRLLWRLAAPFASAPAAPGAVAGEHAALRESTARVAALRGEVAGFRRAIAPSGGPDRVRLGVGLAAFAGGSALAAVVLAGLLSGGPGDGGRGEARHVRSGGAAVVPPAGGSPSGGSGDAESGAASRAKGGGAAAVPPATSPPPRPTAAEAPVTGVTQEAALTRALGLVLCGFELVPETGDAREFSVSSGTAFAVTPDGYLFTNKHVVKELVDFRRQPGQLDELRRLAREKFGGPVAVNPTVWVFFGTEKFRADVRHVSDKYDFAVLKADRTGPYFRLREQPTVPRGEKVFALGFPGAGREALSDAERLDQRGRKAGRQLEDQMNPRDFEFVLTNGIVGRLAPETDGTTWLQHNAAINPGNSGGPLITEDGTVVGINTLGHVKSQGVFFSLGVPQLRAEFEAHVRNATWK